MPGAAGSSPTSSGVRPGRGCRRCTGGCSEVPTRATPSSRASSMPSSAFTGSLAAGSPTGTSPTPAPTPGPAGGARLPTRPDARSPHSCGARPRRHHDRSVRPAHDAREPRAAALSGSHAEPARGAGTAHFQPVPHALIGSAQDHVGDTNNNSRGRCAMKRSTGKSPGRIHARIFDVDARRSAHRAGPQSLAVRFRWVAASVAFVVPFAMVVPLAVTSAQAAPAPAGNGFVVTASDIAYILKQIKIAERHSATETASNRCGTLVGPGPDQVPDRLTSYGLRTVDGSCNNLFAGREKFAAADVPFPRLTTPDFRAAETNPPDFFGPGSGTIPSNGGYTQKLAGNLVFDSEPRTASNLIVDQTSTNPAAIAAAGHPVRSQSNPGLFPCTTD